MASCFICPGVKFEIGRHATLRIGRWSWIGHGSQDPRARGRSVDRREDRDGPGVHDLRLPARVDRPRVHHRRPRDADRLRPRRRGGRAPDPPAGHLQARRARGKQRMDGIWRVRATGSERRRTTASSAQARWSPRTCPRTPSWAAFPRACCACATRRSEFAGSSRRESEAQGPSSEICSARGR